MQTHDPERQRLAQLERLAQYRKGLERRTLRGPLPHPRAHRFLVVLLWMIGLAVLTAVLRPLDLDP